MGLVVEDVYREHFNFVWRSLRRLGVPEREVPDAVQDVFVVVHRKLAEFEGRSKVTTWLYGICFRVASDLKRLKRTRCEIPTDKSDELSSDQSADASSCLEQKQALAQLERILDHLPIEQRAVFTLFELEGLPCTEIAELVDAPLGTVYSRLRLARDTFTKSLARLHAHEQFRFARIGEHQA